MSNRRTFVIVGGGLAGASAAATLREDGFDGRVVLVGSEQEQPYHRPPLSKEYLRGEVEEASLRVNEPSLYRDQEIELRLGNPGRLARRERARGRARRRRARRLRRRPARDGLRAAQRSRCPGPSSPASTTCGRTPTPTRSRASLKQATRIAIIGGGWIGCEVAASARQLGVEVTLVSPTRLLLEQHARGQARRLLP